MLSEKGTESETERQGEDFERGQSYTQSESSREMEGCRKRGTEREIEVWSAEHFFRYSITHGDFCQGLGAFFFVHCGILEVSCGSLMNILLDCWGVLGCIGKVWWAF